MGPFWELIRKGIKTRTCRRPRKKRPIKEGDILYLYWKQRLSRKFKEKRGEPHQIAVARCMRVRRMQYRDFAFDDDFARKEGFADSAELRKLFGRIAFLDTLWYDVIDFEVISSPDSPPMFPGILAMVEK